MYTLQTQWYSLDRESQASNYRTSKSPLYIESRDPRLFCKHMPHESLYLRGIRSLILFQRAQFFAVIFCVHIVADSYKLLFFVRSSQKDDGDAY